ncbi:MAG: hypothetical protein C0483_09725 [Pirellula sp.]|nr:hypothetical protein [Pirellula sp.]
MYVTMSDLPEFSEADLRSFEAAGISHERAVELVSTYGREMSFRFAVSIIDKFVASMEALVVPDETDFGKGVAKGLQQAVRSAEDIGSTIRQMPAKTE